MTPAIFTPLQKATKESASVAGTNASVAVEVYLANQKQKEELKASPSDNFRQTFTFIGTDEDAFHPAPTIEGFSTQNPAMNHKIQQMIADISVVIHQNPLTYFTLSASLNHPVDRAVATQFHQLRTQYPGQVFTTVYYHGEAMSDGLFDHLQPVIGDADQRINLDNEALNRFHDCTTRQYIDLIIQASYLRTTRFIWFHATQQPLSAQTRHLEHLQQACPPKDCIAY